MRVLSTLALSGLLTACAWGCGGSSKNGGGVAARAGGTPMMASTAVAESSSAGDNRHSMSEFGRGKRQEKAASGTKALLGARGTYSGEPRDGEGRVDVARLVEELVDVGANTYNFLIKRGERDWDDLQLFLPQARENGIHVWVTVVCPSKKSGASQPFGHDYVRWATEIAKLSVREPNLVAWGMDDFSYNGDHFTRKRMKQILGAARAINPHLAFVPTVYYKHAVRPGYAEQYRGMFDAVLFPYRAESSGLGNLEDAGRVDEEIRAMRATFGRKVPVILDVYASRHSRMGSSTPAYVKRVLDVGRSHADGVIVFRHQERGTKKWEVVSTSFREE